LFVTWLCYVICGFIVKVSPTPNGTHPQMLVTPTSNLATPQAFKGMREDEV